VGGLRHVSEILVRNDHRAVIERDQKPRHRGSPRSSLPSPSDCQAARSFNAKESGIVASAKHTIPSGARIPVSTKTAAHGKNATPNGTSRQSKAVKSSFLVQVHVAVGELVAGAIVWFVCVTTHYVVVLDHESTEWGSHVVRTKGSRRTTHCEWLICGGSTVLQENPVSVVTPKERSPRS
jgi:hypothetical protein